MDNPANIVFQLSEPIGTFQQSHPHENTRSADCFGFFDYYYSSSHDTHGVEYSKTQEILKLTGNRGLKQKVKRNRFPIAGLPDSDVWQRIQNHFRRILPLGIPVL